MNLIFIQTKTRGNNISICLNNVLLYEQWDDKTYIGWRREENYNNAHTDGIVVDELFESFHEKVKLATGQK